MTSTFVSASIFSAGLILGYTLRAWRVQRSPARLIPRRRLAPGGQGSSHLDLRPRPAGFLDKVQFVGGIRRISPTRWGMTR